MIESSSRFLNNYLIWFLYKITLVGQVAGDLKEKSWKKYVNSLKKNENLEDR